MILLCTLLCFLLQGCHKEAKLEKAGTLITNEENSSKKNDISQQTDSISSFESSKSTDDAMTAGSEDCIAEKDGNVDDQTIKSVNHEIGKIPEPIMQQFQKCGWHMYVTDADINERFYHGKYSTVLGTTQYADKTIFIADTSDAAKDSTIHEIGHFVDYSNGFLSDQEEFKELYFSDVQNYIKSYNAVCVRDRKELFAEVFWQYLIDPSKLQLISPSLYSYMKNTIQSIYFE